MYKAYRHSYKRVLRYRCALGKLSPRLQPTELATAETIWRRLISTGLMQSFLEFDLTKRQMTDADFQSGPIIWGCIDSQVGFGLNPQKLRVPFFLDLLNCKKVSKECIVCTEEKKVMDCSEFEEFYKYCANSGWDWAWTVLQYPTGQSQKCEHSLDVCQQCLVEHISVAISDGRFERIMCPQCNRILTYGEIKALCPRDIFMK
jgi:hypothetical protein